MKRLRSRTGQALAAGAAGAALLGLGYVGLTWARYGRKPMAGAVGDPLIDAFLPDPEVRERHQTVVAAPADVTWAAVQDLDAPGTKDHVRRVAHGQRRVYVESQEKKNREGDGAGD